MFRRVAMIWSALMVIVVGILCPAGAFAGPMASLLVRSDVFTPGDEVEFWVTAVNWVHDFVVDVYLVAESGGMVWYLGPGGWKHGRTALISALALPQFESPVLVKLASAEAGEVPLAAGKRATVRLVLTPSGVPDMVYCEDEVEFSVAPEGFVAIPSGRFLMGCADYPYQTGSEIPRHKVCLHSYFIARTETTVEEYAEFLNEMGLKPDEEGEVYGPEGHPLLALPWRWFEYKDGHFQAVPGCEELPCFVTWYGAQRFCEWRGARLPSEAQWEYAARAFSYGTFPWGEEASCDYANFAPGWKACVGDVVPVGSYPGNDWGLYDVIGNLAEYCSDWCDFGLVGEPVWGKYYYEWCQENYPNGIVDPEGPPCYYPEKVTRGGCYALGEFYSCLCGKNREHVEGGSLWTGFRPVIEVPR